MPTFKGAVTEVRREQSGLREALITYKSFCPACDQADACVAEGICHYTGSPLNNPDGSRRIPERPVPQLFEEHERLKKIESAARDLINSMPIMPKYYNGYAAYCRLRDTLEEST